MLTIISGVIFLYLTGLSAVRYFKVHSWEKVRDNVFLAIINLVIFQIGLKYECDIETAHFTTAVYTLLGLFTLYFAVLSIEAINTYRSWAPVRKKVNFISFAMLLMFVFGPFPFPEDGKFSIQIVWTAVVVLFALLALWNLCWATFTKKEVSAFARLATGVTVGLYAAPIVTAYKAFFVV